MLFTCPVYRKSPASGKSGSIHWRMLTRAGTLKHKTFIELGAGQGKESIIVIFADYGQMGTSMGVLFDLVIADEGAAEAVGRAERLFDHFRVLPTKILDHVTLDQLFLLIDSGSVDIGSWWEVPLFEEEELVVHQLPPYFVERLACLPENERADLARRWGQTEELQHFYEMYQRSTEAKLAEVRDLLDELCGFSLEATESGKCIFLRCVP